MIDKSSAIHVLMHNVIFKETVKIEGPAAFIWIHLDVAKICVAIFAKS